MHTFTVHAHTHLHLSAWLHQIIKLNDLSEHTPATRDTLIRSLSARRVHCVRVCETENVHEKSALKLSSPPFIRHPLDIDVEVSIDAVHCQNSTMPLTAVKLWSEGH